jgi:hypothetical protein
MIPSWLNNRWIPVCAGIAALTVAVIVNVTACGVGNAGGNVPQDFTFQYSFDSDLEGWTPRAFDTEVGGAEIDWSVASSSEQQTAGAGSAKYSVSNLTDAAKVFLEREFELEPNTEYDFELAFDFATDDWGDINLWTLIAGALPSAPDVPEDLEPSYQGDTGTGSDIDAGYVWLDKHITGTVTTGADGRAVVVIGVWGTWESLSEYYIDNLIIDFHPPAAAE